MQFLTVSQRRATASGEVWDALREAETQRARALYAEGHIRHIWHRADVVGACIVWEADNEEDVRELLGTLPFVQANLLEVEVIPLKPYGGFAPR